MPHHHFQDLHSKWGPPKCSSQGSPHLLVFKSLEATLARCRQGSGCCLTARSSKLLSRGNPKGGLGSHQLDQALHKTKPEMASSFLGAPFFYDLLCINCQLGPECLINNCSTWTNLDSVAQLLRRFHLVKE